jgi:hypothetical protein
MIFDVFRVSGFDVSHIIAFDAPEELFFLGGGGRGKRRKRENKFVTSLLISFTYRRVK